MDGSVWLTSSETLGPRLAGSIQLASICRMELAEGPVAANKCVFCELLATGKAEWVAREERAAAFALLPGGQLSPSPRSTGPTARAK